MKKTRDGGIAAALAKMFDKCLDRVWIYPGRRRELEPLWIVTGEKPKIPSIRRAKTYSCCGSQMCSSPLFIENIATFKCGSPQRLILCGPRGEVQMLFRDGRHYVLSLFFLGLIRLRVVRPRGLISSAPFCSRRWW
jgi:hypothetical protein